MKSVGEVMAIGRTFPEVLQKALRMLDIGAHGLDPDAFPFDDVGDQLQSPTPYRPFAIARALRDGMSVDAIHDLTQIDRWFLNALVPVVAMRRASRQELSIPRCCGKRRNSASAIPRSGELTQPRTGVRALRQHQDIVPHLAQIDTLAAEFPAETNYLYTTYHARQDDIDPSWRKKIMVLGSGAYRIGSSVEFDWCCVNAIQAASELGYETIMLNYNPETVSTDYDVCDTLIFDEISFETVMDIVERERPFGVVVSMGGQVPNNLALRLHQAGCHPRHERREHRPGGRPQEILGAPRRAGHRPAAVGTSNQRGGCGESRCRSGRVSGARASQLRALGRRDERRPRTE
jgi:carbamoyl-phosphate synthase large subunit